MWVNPTTPDLREEQRFDRYPDSVVPGPGGTSLHFVTFPPSSVFADPSFESEVARREALIRLRGLADHFLYVTKKKVQLIVLLNITYKCETPNVSEERPICRRRAHHGGSRIRPRRGNLVRDPRRQRERRSHLRSEVTLQTLESRLGGDKARQERIERACASSPTDHAVGHTPSECATTGICDSLLSCGKEVPGKLQPQGMHVGGSFSGSGQFREITRENNPGRFSSSGPRKDALTFFDSNCANNKNSTAGKLKESSQSKNTI